MPSVSVVIVSYNTRDALRQCLQSLADADEVIVVDNASRDGSAAMVAEEYPGAKLIRNELNRGFGAGCNQGVEAATSELVLFLNSDARAETGAIRALAAVFQDRSVVAAGGQLRFPDGTLQLSSAGRLTLWALLCEQSLLEKIAPNSRVMSPYWNSRMLAKRSEPSATEQVMGACLMVRSEIAAEERFDERFFLYCEDTELCRRLLRHGSILYVPAAQFAHDLGQSSTGARWWSVAMYNRGKELYFRIHHGPVAACAALLLNRLGAMLRLLIWGLPTLATLCLIRRFRSQTALFAHVLLAPVNGPRLPSDSVQSPQGVHRPLPPSRP